MGDAQSRSGALIVFALAIAVTSIPVISRIMYDLGVIETSFARVVLAVAVLEDVFVYIVLAMTLSLTDGSARQLELQGRGATGLGFHVAATLGIFVGMLSLGARGFSWFQRQRWNLVARSNAIAYHLLFLFAGALVCVSLGVTPVFGAFLVGIAVSADQAPSFVRARESIKAFSFAFFVPVYFAVVGLQFDLARHLDVMFLGWFLVLACVVSREVLRQHRLAGETRRGAQNLALATNARGGPCIVLASVTFAAGIISEEFYTAMVMLAIMTSMVAGTMLARVVRAGAPLRDEPKAQVS